MAVTYLFLYKEKMILSVLHIYAKLLKLKINTLHFTYFSKPLRLRFITHYTLLTYYFKPLMLRFLSHYTLLTYFSKLLKLRFLAHYILLTYFSKLLKVRFFNILHSVYLVSKAEIFNAIRFAYLFF